MYTSMKTGIVQFREDETVLRRLRREKINPNQFARQAFDAALRRKEIEANMRALRAMPIRLGEPAPDAIRRDRDSH